MIMEIVCFVSWDVITLEINLIFLIKPFFSAWQKKPKQNFKYLEKEKSFYGKIKNIFRQF